MKLQFNERTYVVLVGIGFLCLLIGIVAVQPHQPALSLIWPRLLMAISSGLFLSASLLRLTARKADSYPLACAAVVEQKGFLARMAWDEVKTAIPDAPKSIYDALDAKFEGLVGALQQNARMG